MRRSSALLVLLLAGVLISACALSEPLPEQIDANHGGSVTITFGVSEDERMTYTPLITSFNQANPAIYVQFVALPRTLSLPLLSYNKDLWTKHGLPAPASHWTWQDLTTSAMQLASVDGNTTDSYGLLEWSGGLSGLYGELALASIDIASTPREQLQLDRPEVVAALNRVVGLVKARRSSSL